MPRILSAHLEEWKYTSPIRITGHVFPSARVLVAEISENGAIGRGEASGVYFRNDTPDHALDQVLACADAIREGAGRVKLNQILPPGGARNALDCALWDLECRLSGRDIWSLTGITPKPILTLQTITMQNEPEDVGRMASALRDAPMLKIKLNGDRPVERVRAARLARPDVRLMVDVNACFDMQQLRDCAGWMGELGVELIEQPLPAGEYEALEDFVSPVPLCADESCIDRQDLETVARLYQAINIKLDKTGGLTEALALAAGAKQRGLKLMVGNMSGTSLAVAPSYVIAMLCEVVDLDGPYSLVCDRAERMLYRDSIVSQPEPRFWG